MVRLADLVVDLFQIALLLCWGCPGHIAGLNILQIVFTLQWLELKGQVLIAFVMLILESLLRLVISLDRFGESWDLRNEARTALLVILFLSWASLCLRFLGVDSWH